MNPQLELLLPIPILEEIIFFATLADKLTFRQSCKLFLQFTTNRFFPTFTTTLCGGACGYKDENFHHAQFDGPSFGVVDSLSTVLFVSDCWNNVIRKIDLYSNDVSTLYGTSIKHLLTHGLQYRSPLGLALNEEERVLYFADAYNHVIKKVDLTNGEVKTLVGNARIYGRDDKIGKEATFYLPYGLALDSISNFLYVADSGNHSIRRVILKERRVETLCGTEKEGFKNGSFKNAKFDIPFDIVWNAEAQELYVSDYDNHVIRNISLKTKTVSTLCGTPGVWGCENGSSTEAKFRHPRGLGLDSHSQCLYVSDANHIIRKIFPLKEGKVSLLCGVSRKKGDKGGLLPLFKSPKGIVVDPQSQNLYVMDSGNHKVKQIVNRKRISL